jgi:hypothetical protein
LETDGITIKKLRLVGTITAPSGPGQVTVARAISDDRTFVDWMRDDTPRNVGFIQYDETGSAIRRWAIEQARPESLKSDEVEEFFTLRYESVRNV